MEVKSDESGSPRALKTEDTNIPVNEASPQVQVNQPAETAGGLEAKGGARSKVGGGKKRRSKAAKNHKPGPDAQNKDEEKIQEEVMRSLRSSGVLDELRRECSSAVNAMANSKNPGSTSGARAGNLPSQQKSNPSLNQRSTRAKLRGSMKSSNVKKVLSQIVDKAIDERRDQIRKQVEEAYYSRLGLRVPGKSSEEDSSSSSSSSDDSEVDEELHQSWVAEYNEKYGGGRQIVSASGSNHQGVQNQQRNEPGYVQQMGYPAQSNYHGWYGMGPGMPAVYAPMQREGTSSVDGSASGETPSVSAQQSSPYYCYGPWGYPYSYQYPGTSYGAQGGPSWQGMPPSSPYSQQYAPPYAFHQGEVMGPTPASVQQSSMDLPYMLSLPPPPPPSPPQKAVAQQQVDQDSSKAESTPSKNLPLVGIGGTPPLELAVNSASSLDPPHSSEDDGVKFVIQELEITHFSG